MQEINATNRYFLHLLSAGLGGHTPQPLPDGVSFSDVYTIAKRHRVDNLVFAAVNQLERKPDFFDKWYKKHCMAVARSATQLYEYTRICSALVQAGASILPYKGIVLKSYYPEASMRDMSDIDMLYLAPNGDHERIKEVMESLEYTTEQFGTGVHDTYHKPPLMSVELHRVIFSPDADGYLSNAEYMAAATPDQNGVLMLPLPYLYLASLTHTVKHLRTDCTDLRSVTDLYLLRRAMTEKQAMQADGLIQNAKLTQTDAALLAVARHIFDGENANDRTLACLSYLLRSPMDAQSVDAKYLSTYQKGGSVGKAKLRYLWHLVLPGYTYMKKNYPILAKAPVLLPVWWPVRWIDVLLHQRGRAKNALHRFDGMTNDDTSKAKDDLALFGLK